MAVLYERVMKGKKVTYREYVAPPEQEPEIRNLTDKQLITAAGALGVTLLCLYERHFPPHKRVAKKVKAVEAAILDLFHGTGEKVDVEIADWMCANWDRAMKIGEFGVNSPKVHGSDMFFKDQIQKIGDAAGLKGRFLVDYGVDHITGIFKGKGLDNDRAVEMLSVAAKYIREHCPDSTIFYDEATCDGYCVADDCETAAASLKS